MRTWAAPEPALASRGAIVFGMGGTGDSWTVTRVGDPNHREHQLVKRLTREGFIVFERAWEQGWWGATSNERGLSEAACRYRALVHQLALETTGPLCVFGNSGGSSEIAYGLTHHDLAQTIQFAVLGGGPPMGRIDYGCSLDRPPSDWNDRCSVIWEDTQNECDRPTPKCFYEGRVRSVFDSSYTDTPCTRANEEDLLRLASDSVVSPGATLDYPNTRVHFVVGRNDCTEAPILGMLYFEAITSDKSRDVVRETPHRTIESSQGAEAVFRAMLTHCTDP